MSEADFLDALDPRKIVEARRTSGSAAPAEVAAMLEEDRAQLEVFKAQTAALDEKIADSLAALEKDFGLFAAAN